jgi:hypothetical protein
MPKPNLSADVEAFLNGGGVIETVAEAPVAKHGIHCNRGRDDMIPIKYDVTMLLQNLQGRKGVPASQQSLSCSLGWKVHEVTIGVRLLRAQGHDIKSKRSNVLLWSYWL